ncbi:hypothetical protein BN874_1920014 [Candidatus Contendobacter odensis Run_B_J11]|uniref:Uncharacterized protein n=1 Tax=Candidatus Contendobacter odensis Run_B_J11 TaxID=1400861 RepID=A0A7U7GAH3_9GAMM|nr:hypothetical protein BN874_1920014 [Candidatus Contendobacter odensis Run_B_J11]
MQRLSPSVVRKPLRVKLIRDRICPSSEESDNEGMTTRVKINRAFYLSSLYSYLETER